MADLATDPQSILPALGIALGVAALVFRQTVKRRVDRWFFPGLIRRRELFSRVTRESLRAVDGRSLAATLRRGLSEPLAVERLGLLAEEPTLGHLVDPEGHVRPLDLASPLASLVQGFAQPLEVDLEAPSPIVRDLPEADRHWLVDARADVLAPLHGLDGGLRGLLVLGRSPEGPPFSTYDRRSIERLCGVLGDRVDLMLDRRPDPTTSTTASNDRDGVPLRERLAQECLRCDRVFPAHAEECPDCRQGLEDAVVPYVLPRRFRFEQRIGTGGMAVVYRATDLNLGRTVAIKTLPRVAPEAAIRLHREARAAATVAHPGLAAIYGFETWRGMPMLILELLEGGTLASRIAKGKLPAVDIVDTGIAVVEALASLHAAGILHRDIKPSNIGYTRNERTKLLDFGIARIESDLRRDPSVRHPSTRSLRLDQTAVAYLGSEDHPSAGGQLVGTVCYLSPEAIDSNRADPSSDLWALSVVLFEAATGRNLFYATSLAAMLDRIRTADVPDLETLAPETPAALAAFLHRCLERDPSLRPTDADAYRSGLEAVRSAIG